MKHTQLITSVILALSHALASTQAGTWSFTPLTGDDAETGIDVSKKYTHLVDFGADAAAATINGVKFTAMFGQLFPRFLFLPEDSPTSTWTSWGLCQVPEVSPISSPSLTGPQFGLRLFL